MIAPQGFVPRRIRPAFLVAGALASLAVGFAAGRAGGDDGSRTVRGVVTNVAADGSSLCIGRTATAIEGPCARPALVAGQRLPSKGDRVEAELVTMTGGEDGAGVTVFVFPPEERQ